MTKASDGRNQRRRMRRLGVIPGGRQSTVEPPGYISSAITEAMREQAEKTPDGRFTVALTQFVQGYLREERDREDAIDEITMAGVLLRMSAGIAAAKIGEDGEQFVQAAQTIYDEEYPKTRKNR